MMMELILACAPNVAPSTIQEIIRVESNSNPIAVNVNTMNGTRFKSTFVFLPFPADSICAMSELAC